MAKEATEVNLSEWIKEHYPEATISMIEWSEDGSEMTVKAFDRTKNRIINFALPTGRRYHV